MLQAPSHPTKVVQGGHTYVIPSSHATPNQPFSIMLGKRGKIEVSYEQRTAKPVISVSHVSSSSKREERSHESSPRPSRSPRSDVATIGSSTYMHRSSSKPRESHSSPRHSEQREHKSSPSRHAHHELPSSAKSPYVGSNGLLAVPGANEPYERQRRHSSSHAEGGSSRPIAIPSRPAASPEKHAHFALPHSAPDKYALPERVSVSASASPRQPSRHHHSHSQDSYFREAPRGWYNRRGDQFIQKGLVRRQPEHLQWHRVFANYPEPGQGWMNEEKQILPYHGGILAHK